MRYLREDQVFVVHLDDMTTRCALRFSVNEAARLRDALVIYFAELEPPPPADEPTLISGDA